MADNPLQKQFKSLLASIGRAGLNAIFPHDFEYYMCSLELVNAEGVTEETFTFPIMPSSIAQKEDKILNIEKSQGGITTTNTTTFEPIDVSISGNFGRRFRFIIGGVLEDFTSITSKFKKGGSGRDKSKPRRFSKSLMTGYATFKTLQTLYRKANSLDDKGNPYRMYFYNPAIGDNFLVRLTSFTGKMDESSNMIWNYDLKMVALAEAESAAAATSRAASVGKMLAAAIAGRLADRAVEKLTSKLP